MNSERSVFFVMILLLAAAAACRSTPSPTAPAPGPVADYPDSRYLSAAGYGETPAEAEREARAAIAAVFSSRVYSETMASATSAFGLNGQEQFQKEVASSVRVISDVALEGVAVVPRGRDPQSGAYAALAVLDRRQAAARWQRQLDTVTGQLGAELAALPSVRGTLLRLSALNRITALALQQGALASRLRVVGGAAAMAAEPADLLPVREELATLRQQTAFFIRIEGGPHAETAARIIRAAVSKQGLRFTDTQSDAAGWITGELVLQPLNLDNPAAQFVRAVITLDITDARAGVSLKSLEARVRKGHADEVEATRMAVSGAAEEVAGGIVDAVGRMGWAAEADNP